MALVIWAAGGRQLRQREHLHRWLAVTHPAKAKLTHLWIWERRRVRWSQVATRRRRAETELGVVKHSEEDLRWSRGESGRPQRPQGHRGLSPIAPPTPTPPFFYEVPPLGGVWGILRAARWSHHGGNRCWWCLRDITSTSKPPALLSYFFTRWGWAPPRQSLDGRWSVHSLFSYKIMTSMSIAETSKCQLFFFFFCKLFFKFFFKLRVKQLTITLFLRKNTFAAEVAHDVALGLLSGRKR